MIELKPAINEVKLTLKSISSPINLGTVVEPVSGGSVPTEVRQAIYTLLENAAYATTGLEDEIAIVQAWAQEVTALSLEPTSLELSNDTPQTIVATVVPSGSTITWTSSDNSVATVVAGVVTGVGNGSCVITATAGGKSANCAVTVSGFVTLESISAVYTQSGTVSTTTPLDDLKADLVVTATYSDTSTETVPSNSYTLSGTLTAGTSTITVTYSGKTDTFNVTVTSGYVTDGLIAYWDGIDNTGSGHDASASAWTDLVNGYVLTKRENTHTVWGDDCVNLDGNNLQGFYSANQLWTRPENATIEFVIKPTSTSTQCIGNFDVSDSAISGTNYDTRRFAIFGDGTVGFVGKSGKTYSNPETALTAIRKLAATYTNFTVNNAYVNNTEASLSGNTHSFQYVGTKQYRIGVENLTGSGQGIYPYYGKIYAIRVYNKILTTAELTQNMAYDNERFNLGL